MARARGVCEGSKGLNSTLVEASAALPRQNTMPSRVARASASQKA